MNRKLGNNRYDEMPDCEAKTLVEIVCRHYNADPNLVLGGNHLQTATTPRNIIATLWSRVATLRETSELVGWKSAQQVCQARNRVSAIAQKPINVHRLRGILDEISLALPFLIEEDGQEVEIKNEIQD